MKSSQSKPDADGKLKNGVFKDYYKNGALACSGRYQDGVKAGVWKYYLRNGQLRAVGKCTAGRMTGAWKWYRENGKLMQTGSFLEEKKSGVWKRYHPNGALYDEGEFAYNKKIGEWRVYNTKGKLVKTTKHKPRQENPMSKVRLLIGTKKGAFILTADGKRKDWEVSGPHFAGWELYHLKGSPVEPNRIYASQTSGWFGQVIQRSDDGGKTWNPPGTKPEDLMSPDGMPKGASNMFSYEGDVGTHKFYDGNQHPWEFKRIWHIEPSLTDPDTAFAGAEDAAIFKTIDGGKTWKELPALRMGVRINS